MLSSEIQALVLPALKQGRYALLLGAGASMASHAKDGSSLPSGSSLTAELAEKYELPAKYSLARITSSIDDQESLAQYLIERFSGCKPSDGALRLPTFVWRSIYTLNIDDVLQESYRIAASSRLQKIKTLTYADAYYEPDDTDEVKAIFLHGSVSFPDRGFVFSLQDYGRMIARDSVWLKILADEITYTPFIIIGTSLEEADIEYYLARRSSLPPDEINSAPSLFVAKTIDAVTRATCRRFGLVPIESEAERFILELDRLAGPRPSALDLVLPKSRDSFFAEFPNERSQRIFFRQWLVVDPQELPTLPASAISLLRGTEPHWEQLSGHQDVPRATVGEMIQRILIWIQAGDKRHRALEILFASSGAGKSTALMRLGLDLAASGVRVFQFTGNERIADFETAEVLVRLKTPAVLIIDSIAEHGTQVTALLKRLGEKRYNNLYVVGAERTQRRERVFNDFVDMPFRSTELAKLSSSESLSLVHKMRAEGLLGRRAGRADAELSVELRAKDLFSAVLILTGSAPNVERIAMTEWEEMSSDARLVYSVVALAHACNFTVRIAILSRATSLDASKTWRVLLNDLKGIVFRTGQELARVETRHRRIAEFTMRGMPLEQRFSAFVGLARALAPYINRNSIKRSTDDARLGGRLLDFDDTVKPFLDNRSRDFYEAIRSEWGWNSRYWEQRALLEIDNDPDLALQYAETAIGIENHPFPLTTLAKVHYRLALKPGSPTIALTHLRKGLESADEAIRRSRAMNRPEPHPFRVSLRSMLDICSSVNSSMPWVIDPFIDQKFREFLEGAHGMIAKSDLDSWKTRWEAIRRMEPSSSSSPEGSGSKQIYPKRTKQRRG